MMTGRALKDVKRALDTITAERRQAGDAEVYRFDLSPQTGALGYGAGWHPSMRQQQKTANELTAYLEDREEKKRVCQNIKWHADDADATDDH